MPPINILMKPASSLCNMKCKYCFYHAIAKNRESHIENMMSVDLVEKVIIKGLSYADKICAFTFQGGEPTLVGLDFYKKVVEFQKRHNKKDVKILNSIQTNGYIIDEEYCKFFKENKFLVGISLDGSSDTHNFNRVDNNNKDTFNKIMKSINLFKKYEVEYNVLSVVTGKNAKHIGKTYNFFKKNKIKHIQFIPCIEPIEDKRGTNQYYLSVENYGKFLVEIFELWYKDFLKGEYTSIRYIDNIIYMVLGERPEACNMNGKCSPQYVVESNGNVYPCDFYVFDEWNLGSIEEKNFQEISENPLMNQFIKESIEVPKSCLVCNYFELCKNGCKRDRVFDKKESMKKNYYCESYKYFFSKSVHKINHCADTMRNRWSV